MSRAESGKEFLPGRQIRTALYWKTVGNQLAAVIMKVKLLPFAVLLLLLQTRGKSLLESWGTTFLPD